MKGDHMLSRIYLNLILVVILSYNNACSQKLHEFYERGKYDKIHKVIQEKGIQGINNVFDIQTCATFSFINGNYALASKFFEKGFDMDEASFREQDFINYAYCLLLLNEKEKIKNSSILKGKEQNSYWLSYVKSIVNSNPDELKGNEHRYTRKEVRLNGFLCQYGIYCAKDKLYYSSSPYANAKAGKLFETNILLNGKRNLTHIVSVSYDEAKRLTEPSVVKMKGGKNSRIVTYNTDRDGRNSFFTVVPLNGRTERILIRGELKNFSYNSGKYACAMPFYDEHSNKLYFCSDMPGGFGGWDIYYSEWVNNSWSGPINLGNKVNTPLDETFPSVNNGALLFSSNGHKGLGGFDHYSYDENSNRTTNLSEFNSAGDDFSLHILSEDMESAVGVADSVLVFFKLREELKKSTDDGGNTISSASGRMLNSDSLKIKFDLAGDDFNFYIQSGNLELAVEVIDSVVVSFKLDNELERPVEDTLVAKKGDASSGNFKLEAKSSFSASGFSDKPIYVDNSSNRESGKAINDNAAIDQTNTTSIVSGKVSAPKNQNVNEYKSKLADNKRNWTSGIFESVKDRISHHHVRANKVKETDNGYSGSGDGILNNRRKKASFTKEVYNIPYHKKTLFLPHSQKNRLDSIAAYARRNNLFIIIKGISKGSSVRDAFPAYRRAENVFHYLEAKNVPGENLSIIISKNPSHSDIKNLQFAVENKIQLILTHKEMPYQLMYDLGQGSARSLSDISKDYNNDLEELRMMNDLHNESNSSDSMLVGIQKLYQVSMGECLYRIAINHGCDWMKLRQINKKNRNIILLGEILLIPFCVSKSENNLN